MENEERKIKLIMDMLEGLEEELISLDTEDFGYVAGKVDALKDVLDILQGE